MFLVHFTNFAYSAPFTTKEGAIHHMEHSGFESTLTDDHGRLYGNFRPLYGKYVEYPH
jgi:hypothetical protein